jgi:hypothetical protein
MIIVSTLCFLFIAPRFELVASLCRQRALDQGQFFSQGSVANGVNYFLVRFALVGVAFGMHRPSSRADEGLTAFLELERAICVGLLTEQIYRDVGFHRLVTRHWDRKSAHGCHAIVT